MAQVRTRHMRGIARRMGIRGHGKAITALVAVVCALGGVGVARTVSGGGMQLERGTLAQEALLDAENEGAPAAGEASSGEEGEPEVPSEVVVHVDGAVGAPGVYRLEGDSPRVGDAVDRAGGLADDADTTNVNLAAPLADGQKVYVPHAGEQASEQGGGVASAATAGSDVSGLININTATESELTALPGVGEATARAIVEERERGGPFSSPEDIMRVSGIGEKKYERMQGLIGV